MRKLGRIFGVVLLGLMLGTLFAMLLGVIHHSGQTRPVRVEVIR